MNKSSNKLTIILLLGAMLTGGIGWFLTQDYINNQVSSYKDSFDDQRQAVQVVVAATDLKIGDVVNTKTARISQIPKAYLHKDAVVPNAYQGVLHGKQILHPLSAGEPILKIHVSHVKVDGLASLLKEGERAITIPVDSLDTLSGFLAPGDYIDLLVTVKDGERDRTVPLLQNIRILATGKDIDDGIKEKSQKRYGEITVGVSPLHATKLIHAQTVGDIAVLLRRPEDEGSLFEDYVTIDNLVDIPQDAPPEPPRRSTWGFELIRGGTRS
ncbi:MAG: Flp pilus assembly protein CpaB [Pseudomonadales bacterium]|nr:Flp pilus assembly protein CpaB [Pseudomonadales bacterium]